ncbi:phytase [Croceicoccus naphthovorans]|uniref:3-phytase n=1 Tax=Croceicoccus naphthovorans TaxID=1348774 RepID=A0A0G3XD36_9SPHN|nr:phytase [Croceicoccus naphthovorans]AKM09490.1 3-phytase [Croceicoccus naphthovorans]MBB3991496.1 3-phytase [Croceicoccus naphthovorans]
MRLSFLMFGTAVLCFGAGGCATAPVVSPLPTAKVVARGETAPVGTANADAADDPAIWRNPVDPAKSLIVGTDKKAGLYVYGMDGAVLDFAPDGLLNNVDMVDLGENGAIVAASDRGDPINAAIRLYRLSAAGKLTAIGTVPGGSGEGYGFCLHQTDEALLAYSVLKDGTIAEFALDLGTPSSTPLRKMAVPSQPEGCVVDPRDGTLYIGEENAGIWRFPAGTATGEIVAPIDNAELIADVEGLALVPQGETGGWLIASSQGDSAYAVYRLPGIEYAGRFRIVAGDYGATDETDGIEAKSGNFGPDFPNGIFLAQDGVNAGGAQNFKMVRWDEIIAALELDR